MELTPDVRAVTGVAVLAAAVGLLGFAAAYALTCRFIDDTTEGIL